MTGRRAITATIVIVAVIAFLGVLVWKPQIDPIEPPKTGTVDSKLVIKGAQLADIGNCAVCHTMPGGKAYAGSRALPTPFYSGTAILHAAAQVRELLIGLAATKLGVEASTLKPDGGKIVATGGQSVGYGELVGGDELHVQAQPQSKRKDPKTFSMVGQSVARVDIPAKVTGGEAYVQDMRMPGMVHARIVVPPSPKATVSAVDTAMIEKLPGVLKVHRDGNFLAVIAEREYQSVVAMNALAAATTWAEQETLPNPSTIYEYLKSLPAKNDVILNREAATPSGGKTLSATFKRPYQMHGSIGPSCAIAQFKDGALTVWSHGQGMFPLQASVAELLRMPKKKVRCIHVEGSGCYGHNGADDAGAGAALLAVAFPERPVRLQWMRDQEHTWEPYGSAMLSEVRGTLDAGGNVIDFSYDVWSNTHSTRPEGAGNTMVGWLIAQPFAQPEPKPIPQPTGGGDRNAIPFYKFPSAKVTHHFVPQMPIRVSALRSLGAYMNVFAIESFMDELAAAANLDPVEFRLKHLDDPRAREVIETVADHFDWKNWRKAGPYHGRGFAFAKYKNLAAYVAVALDLEVDRLRAPFLVMARVNSIGCGQGRTNGRQQDQRCERGNTHIIETRKQALRSSATVYPAIG